MNKLFAFSTMAYECFKSGRQSIDDESPGDLCTSADDLYVDKINLQVKTK